MQEMDAHRQALESLLGGIARLGGLAAAFAAGSSRGEAGSPPDPDEQRTAVALLGRVAHLLDQAPVIDIALTDIRPDPNAAVREGGELRSDLLQRLLHTAPGAWEPVLVRPAPAGGGTYLLLDGHHRLEAARRLGLAAVRARVVDADEAGACLLAGAVNALHGQPLTPRERARWGASLIRAGVATSTRQAAVVAGVSHTMVARALRGELDRQDDEERGETAPAERFLRSFATFVRTVARGFGCTTRASVLRQAAIELRQAGEDEGETARLLALFIDLAKELERIRTEG